MIFLMCSWAHFCGWLSCIAGEWVARVVDGCISRWFGADYSRFLYSFLHFPDFFLPLVIGRFRLHVAGCFCNGPFFAENWASRESLHPMLVGFGCNVPALRRLEPWIAGVSVFGDYDEPFMSCGARLPVYTLFAAFFPIGVGLLFLVFI